MAYSEIPKNGEMKGFDLSGLKPAEAGFILDSDSSQKHVFATFSDLVVRGRVSATGSGEGRVFWWDGRKSDLNEFESIVVDACFSRDRSVPHANAVGAIDRIDLDAFRAGVFMRAIRKGLYDPPSDTILGLIFQKDLFNRKVRPVAIALMAMSLCLPLFHLMFILTFVSFIIPPLFMVFFSITFALFPLSAIGMFSGFAFAVWMSYHAKKTSKDFKLPQEFMVAGVLLFFFMGHAGFGLMLYIYMKRSLSKLSNLDQIITPVGRIQRKRYLELRNFLGKNPLAQSRLSNEFEPYAIAFGLRERQIPQ